MSKTCGTCRFASEERPQPGMIQPVLMCRYGPLTPVLLPIPSAHVGMPNATIRAICPPVAPNDWCHRHEPLPPVNN